MTEAGAEIIGVRAAAEQRQEREAAMNDEKLMPIGSKVPKETYRRLRWLAYMSDTTVSAIVAGYIAAGISQEDFSRYQPPDSAQCDDRAAREEKES